MTGVLILGGTGDARRLASALAGSCRVVSSLAGRVREPLLPPGEVRIGGFGGVAGLVSYLRSEEFDAVVDATHPFAAQMTLHAVAACSRLGVPLLVLQRPGWVSVPGDHWVRVPTLADAAEVLPSLGHRVLLTTGRQGVGVFAGSDQWFLIRTVDPPSAVLPPHSEVLLARGPFTRADEVALLRSRHIDVVVTKDSGGSATYPKLEAARELGLPVLMVNRPPLPAGVDTVATPEQAMGWLATKSGVGGCPHHS
ncbi:cobalt-precorrin-6A reductase [Cryptosporangium aurantiacum]|uniref:Precorrin-6A/cobalt-precorrin-6A reductase n=1 Tax=Cryptosporangium aurantiacum TaxID=134849 RepID=A0A1M7MEL7_9ACTN|nr:cobalt-precorrin-6A reductase [Cryptosporangium aurantiacum]SHM89289.1 precorrin-6A/cobalt-precorrin-6A reductase [Cryptosporangium aurantiacum]